MSDDKPLDDAVLEAAAQIIAVYEGEPVHPWRHFISRPEHSFHAPEIVATAAAQPAVRERVAKAQEEEIRRLRAALYETNRWLTCSEIGSYRYMEGSDFYEDLDECVRRNRAALAQEGKQ